MKASSADLTLRIGITLFAVGALAGVATAAAPLLGFPPLPPLWFWLSLLAPAGFITCIAAVMTRRR